MKSIKNLGALPAGMAVLADDVLEFHAARLLLLFSVCGINGRIDGLTKMAKLDFFVRYPQFFEDVSRYLGGGSTSAIAPRNVESSMIRFHYGPWDKRYYHVLSYLEAKGLIAVEHAHKMYRLKLTALGTSIAQEAESRPGYSSLVVHMRRVKELLGKKAGSTLKDIVYRVFREEVADRPLGEVIR